MKRSRPAASTTASRSCTQVSNDTSATSRSESPQPRGSKRTRRWSRFRPSSHGRCTGLRQSNSRCVSQCGARTSAGPFPEVAYASRTPSGAVQKRMCCSTALNGVCPHLLIVSYNPAGDGRLPAEHGSFRRRQRQHPALPGGRRHDGARRDLGLPGADAQGGGGGARAGGEDHGRRGDGALPERGRGGGRGRHDARRRRRAAGGRRENESVTLGRESGCGLTVADHLASRRHCTIERRQDKWVLKDHSSNGTFVTVEGDAEIMLQREEMMLRRSGWISLGHPRAEGGEAVEYSCA